jgi:hypothetical protein
LRQFACIISLDKQKQPPYTSIHRKQYLIKSNIFFSKYADWGIFKGQSLKRVLVVVTLVYLIYLIKDATKRRKAKLEERR